MTIEKFSSLLVKHAEDHDTVPFSGFEEDTINGGLKVEIDDDFLELYQSIKSPLDNIQKDLSDFNVEI